MRTAETPDVLFCVAVHLCVVVHFSACVCFCLMNCNMYTVNVSEYSSLLHAAARNADDAGGLSFSSEKSPAGLKLMSHVMKLQWRSCNHCTDRWLGSKKAPYILTLLLIKLLIYSVCLLVLVCGCIVLEITLIRNHSFVLQCNNKM